MLVASSFLCVSSLCVFVRLQVLGCLRRVLFPLSLGTPRLHNLRSLCQTAAAPRVHTNLPPRGAPLFKAPFVRLESGISNKPHVRSCASAPSANPTCRLFLRFCRISAEIVVHKRRKNAKHADCHFGANGKQRLAATAGAPKRQGNADGATTVCPQSIKNPRSCCS